MSNHVYIAQVLSEAATLLTPVAVNVLTSSFATPLPTGTTLLLEGDDVVIRKQSHYPALEVGLAALVPVNEAASPFEAERAARQDEAEQLLWAALDALPASAATQWVNLVRGKNVLTGLVRPDGRRLCASARTGVHFIVKHIVPV